VADPALERRPARGHRSVGHTADAALDAWASQLPELFEEAAAALADLAAVVPAGTPARDRVVVEARSADLEGLAFAWLNELIGLAEVHLAALGVVTVETLEASDPDGRAWRLVGRIALHGYDESGVRSLRHVKAATFHGLRVRQQPGRWRLHAVVDL
jgi:SHS2 domain-containing protein